MSYHVSLNSVGVTSEPEYYTMYDFSEPSINNVIRKPIVIVRDTNCIGGGPGISKIFMSYANVT